MHEPLSWLALLAAEAMIGLLCVHLGYRAGVRDTEDWYSNPDRHGEMLSVLRNARAILKDGGYAYVKEIDKFLVRIGVVP